MIRNDSDKLNLVDVMTNIDLMKVVTYPNTQWVFVKATNITFYVGHLVGVPIGSSIELPQYLSRNKGLLALVKSRKNGRPYEDNKSFFICLPLHNGADIRGVDTPANIYYKTYCSQGTITQFEGVTLD